MDESLPLDSSGGDALSNPFRLDFLSRNPVELQGQDAQKLLAKLNVIDTHINKPNFIQIFLGDIADGLTVQQAIANHSQIEQLEYSEVENRYGFWGDEYNDEDPNILYGLNPSQVYRLRYAIASIREKLPENLKYLIPDLDTVLRVSSRAAEEIVYADLPADLHGVRGNVKIIDV